VFYVKLYVHSLVYKLKWFYENARCYNKMDSYHIENITLTNSRSYFDHMTPAPLEYHLILPLENFQDVSCITFLTYSFNNGSQEGDYVNYFSSSTLSPVFDRGWRTKTEKSREFGTSCRTVKMYLRLKCVEILPRPYCGVPVDGTRKLVRYNRMDSNSRRNKKTRPETHINRF